MDWPTLTQGIEIHGFEKGPAFDPVIRSQFESGAMLRRARGTAMAKRWKGYYTRLTAADVTAVDTFQDASITYADSFIWWDMLESSSASYVVCLEKPIKFHPEMEDDNSPVVRWRTSEIVFVEAHPTSG